jgi:hypothetical protein
MTDYGGTGGHTFNIVLYQNKYRILDYGPMGRYFNDRWHAHDPDSLWSDERGEYWCSELTDSIAGPAGCDRIRPSRQTWNYEGGESCPDDWDGEETYHPEVCP